MRLFYRQYGQGEPLLILHGLFGASDNWHTIATQLAEQFHVIVPDLRNHGQSPHSGEMNYPVMAADVAELLDTLGLPSAIILGHSMGGKVAMQLALTRPSLVQKLIVADMSPRGYTPLHNEIIAALAALSLESFSSRTEIEEALAGPIPSLNLRRFLLKNLGRAADGTFLWKMNLLAIDKSYPLLRAAVSGSAPYTGPALFIRGAKSEYIRATGEPAIPELFPRAEVHTIADAGHWLHADNPGGFLQIVREFLG
jgi:pimeloyl-ACP methyl ester carboxylesterase